MARSILDHHPAQASGVKLGLMADSIDYKRSADSDISKARRSASKRLRNSFVRMKIALRRRPLLSVMILAILCIILICVVALQVLYRNDNFVPVGRTGMLPKSKNGDDRFEWNGQPYAMTKTGGIYVADEDLEQPTLTWKGHVYNRKNARHLSGDTPSTLTMLPAFLSEEEVREMEYHIQLANENDDFDGTKTTIAFGPLERLIVNRMKPFARLGIERASFMESKLETLSMSSWLEGFSKRFGVTGKDLPKSLAEVRRFFRFGNLEPPYTSTSGFVTNTLELLEMDRDGKVDKNRYARARHGCMVQVYIFLDEPSYQGEHSGGDVLLMNRYNEDWIHYMYGSQGITSDYGDLTFDGRDDEDAKLTKREVLKSIRRDGDKARYNDYIDKAVGMCQFFDEKRKHSEEYMKQITSYGPMKIRPKRGTALVIHGHDVTKIKHPGAQFAHLNTFFSHCDHVGNRTVLSYDYMAYIPETIERHKTQLETASGEIHDQMGPNDRFEMTQAEVEAAGEKYDLWHMGDPNNINTGW